MSRQRIEELAERACARPPAERQAFLDAECGDDRTLRDEVEHLASAVGRVDGFLSAPAIGLLEERPEAPTLDLAHGTRVGPYEIERLLGEGGMGTVYLAHRAARPDLGPVALKLLRPLPAGANFAARFEREGRILAGLDHRHITRLLDGGTTQEGRPYLVMEYVDGLPITRHCDHHRLGLRGRIELFIQVCAAVSRAHRNLVIHRDLKPGNILVNAEGEVKLLDFGIAKLLAPDGASPTVTGERPMTPRYASPEQRAGAPITTSSDVYSLGLVLYELLAGSLPLAAEGPVPRPSVFAERREVAVPPGVSRRRWVRELRGDLDRVVLEAIHLEPERRYTSSEALADDLERFLSHRAVRARGDSFAYRASKFLRRNRFEVLAVSFIALLLIAFAATMAHQASRIAEQARELEQQRDEARRERDRAEEASDLLRDLFGAVDPEKGSGDSVNAARVLELGTRRVRSQFRDRPLLLAEMLHTLGEASYSHDRFAEAESLFSEALELREAALGPRHPDLVENLGRLAILATDRHERAQALAQRAVAIREAALGGDDPRLAEALYWLGFVERLGGDWAASEAAYGRALAIYDRAGIADDPGRAEVLNGMATLAGSRRQLNLALEYGLEALHIRERILGDHHPDTAESYTNVGGNLHRVGRPREGLHYSRRAVEIREATYGPLHSEVAHALSNLGFAELELGEASAAVRSLERAAEILEAAFGPDAADLGVYLHNLGRAQFAAGARETGTQTVERALEIRKSLGRSGRWLLPVVARLAWFALERQRWDEAERHLEHCLEIVEAAGGEDALNQRSRYRVALAWIGFGRLREQRGRADARQAFEHAFVLLGPLTAGPLPGASVRAAKAEALIRLGRPSDAAPIIERLRIEGFRLPELEPLARRHGL